MPEPAGHGRSSPLAVFHPPPRIPHQKPSARLRLAAENRRRLGGDRIGEPGNDAACRAPGVLLPDTTLCEPLRWRRRPLSTIRSSDCRLRPWSPWHPSIADVDVAAPGRYLFAVIAHLKARDDATARRAHIHVHRRGTRSYHRESRTNHNRRAAAARTGFAAERAQLTPARLARCRAPQGPVGCFVPWNPQRNWPSTETPATVTCRLCGGTGNAGSSAAGERRCEELTGRLPEIGTRAKQHRDDSQAHLSRKPGHTLY